MAPEVSCSSTPALSRPMPQLMQREQIGLVTPSEDVALVWHNQAAPAQVDLNELDELIDIGAESSGGGGGAGEPEDAPMEDCGVQTISTDADAAAAAAEVIVAGQQTQDPVEPYNVSTAPHAGRLHRSQGHAWQVRPP